MIFYVCISVCTGIYFLCLFFQIKDFELLSQKNFKATRKAGKCKLWGIREAFISQLLASQHCLFCCIPDVFCQHQGTRDSFVPAHTPCCFPQLLFIVPHQPQIYCLSTREWGSLSHCHQRTSSIIPEESEQKIQNNSLQLVLIKILFHLQTSIEYKGQGQ